MDGTFCTPVVAADAAAVAEVVVALEFVLYGQSGFSRADLEDEWSDLDLERDARVVRDGERIVGYGAGRERGDLWRAEGYVCQRSREFPSCDHENSPPWDDGIGCGSGRVEEA